MRSISTLQGTRSQHFAFVKFRNTQPRLLQRFIAIMPKRKFQQIATDSTAAINASEESRITSTSSHQHRSKEQIAKGLRAGSKISSNSFARPITDGDTLKNTLSDTDSPLSDPPETEINTERSSKPRRRKKIKKETNKSGSGEATKLVAKLSNGNIPPENLPSEDAESEVNEESDEAKIQEALSRPPPINSSYLPLPWKGRLGYVSCPHRLNFEMLDT